MQGSLKQILGHSSAGKAFHHISFPPGEQLHNDQDPVHNIFQIGCGKKEQVFLIFTDNEIIALRKKVLLSAYI